MRFLGVAVEVLVRLALGPSDRRTRHGYPLAWARLQALLATEVACEARQAEDRTGDPHPDSTHLAGEPAWGRPRIPSALVLLGYDVAGATVART